MRGHVWIVLIAIAAGADAGTFELTLVDDAAHGYATFQSHNQKVASGRHGIFMTHLRTRNEAYTAQQWRLSRSVDGGKSFETVYEETNATNPPVIEIDSAGNLYLVRADFEDGDAYLYRFDAESGFKSPTISTIPGGAAGKYAMMLDESRGQLYFFSHNNSFHIVGLNGVVRKRYPLLRRGERAVLQYPQLSLANDGTLFAAWTTQRHDEYLYWDIHFVRSDDGGSSWRNVGGEQLEAPIVADDSGPARRITLDDEFDSHTWLSSFMHRRGKLHFAYLAQMKPGRQHYMRYDAQTGARELDMHPEFKGDAFGVRALDGFFAADEDGALYYVGSMSGRLTCLRSADNGETWTDHARHDEAFHVYSCGGARRATDDGYIIGSFTDQDGSNNGTASNSRVFFFRIRVK